jgi:hypothetical protein
MILRREGEKYGTGIPISIARPCRIVTSRTKSERQLGCFSNIGNWIVANMDCTVLWPVWSGGELYGQCPWDSNVSQWLYKDQCLQQHSTFVAIVSSRRTGQEKRNKSNFEQNSLPVLSRWNIITITTTTIIIIIIMFNEDRGFETRWGGFLCLDVDYRLYNLNYTLTASGYKVEGKLHLGVH